MLERLDKFYWIIKNIEIFKEAKIVVKRKNHFLSLEDRFYSVSYLEKRKIKKKKNKYGLGWCLKPSKVTVTGSIFICKDMDKACHIFLFYDKFKIR
jgi:hypothetical protein